MTTKTALSPDNYVCPQCGAVYTDGRYTESTFSVVVWQLKGYKVEKCYCCKKKERRN